MKDVYILAIESSCDETSIAIVKNGHEVVYMNVLTQMDTHANYGGVVPEIASRMHCENITMVLDDVLDKSKLRIEDMSAIAVTYAPGLLGSLIVGVEFAKTLSYLYDLPLIAVNHIAGHIYANNLSNELKFPCLALVVSGGHTDFVIMRDDYEFDVIGKTLDDAIGEAYDKVARVLDLKYPGGPNVEKLAQSGNRVYDIGYLEDDTYNVSYSGIKSRIINIVHNEKQRNKEIKKEDVACSFQCAAVEQLTKRLDKILKNEKINHVIIAGGVSANKYLREEVKNICSKNKVDLSIPDFKYCTDNAAMIGAAAYPLYLKEEFVDLSLNAKSSLELF